MKFPRWVPQKVSPARVLENLAQILVGWFQHFFLFGFVLDFCHREINSIQLYQQLLQALKCCHARRGRAHAERRQNLDA